ncbi:single-stranded DNA-binding protein [Actinoplanes sp. NPDC049118]|uniref:single-stranded DNA-binding protein n=1 Tax=Actinoplanes sp. NPDC049118 TaxID=3155769 RepID=UPI0033F49446
MFETNVVVVGNVLTAPEWRRTASTNALVANFRVASTARRMDRESGRWVDGNQFRVRVNCWRRLAEGVASSVTVGDPVVVAGRLFTRDWTDADGNLRTTYEMEAVSVGHDLARGRGRFLRNKPAATSTVETAEAEGQIRGESAALVSEEEAPTVYGDGVLDGDEPTFEDVPPLAALRGGTLEPFDVDMAMPQVEEPGSSGEPGPSAEPGSSAEPGVSGEPDPSGEPGPSGEPEAETAGEGGGRRAGRSRGGRRQPVPA